MDVTALPFNQLLALEPASPESGFLVTLPEGPQYGNHLGTVHASALLAVAEAGSGALLVRHLGELSGLVPVVRRMDAKFRKPACGRVSARATVPTEEPARWRSELTSRGRVLATVPMEVLDDHGVIVLSANVEWFISRSVEQSTG